MCLQSNHLFFKNSLDINQPDNALIDVSAPAPSTPELNDNASSSPRLDEKPRSRLVDSSARRSVNRTVDSHDDKARRPSRHHHTSSSGGRPRPRRNSDSSTREIAITSEELELIKAKRAAEMRKSSAPRRKHRGLDIIDQLDCTALYSGA